MTCLTRPERNRASLDAGATAAGPRRRPAGRGSPARRRRRPIRAPSRLTTRVVWMFSPMTMNGARSTRSRASDVASGGHRDELAAVDEQLEEVGLGLELDVLDPGDQRLQAHRGAEPRAAAPRRRAAPRCRPDDPVGRDRREQADLDRVGDVDVASRTRRRGRAGRPGRRSRRARAGGSAGRRRSPPWPGRARRRRSART